MTWSIALPTCITSSIEIDKEWAFCQVQLEASPLIENPSTTLGVGLAVYLCGMPVGDYPRYGASLQRNPDRISERKFPLRYKVATKS